MKFLGLVELALSLVVSGDPRQLTVLMSHRLALARDEFKVSRRRKKIFDASDHVLKE